ncbi:MAG: hypothetical protein ACK53Y_13520, partial [bacterium]
SLYRQPRFKVLRSRQFLFVAILHNKQLFTAALPPIQGGEGQRSTIPPIIPCQYTQLNKHIFFFFFFLIFLKRRPAAKMLNYIE